MYAKDATRRAKDANMCGKDATMCTKNETMCAMDATMCAKDAIMCAKDAAMCAKDRTMCAKDGTMKDKEARGAEPPGFREICTSDFRTKFRKNPSNLSKIQQFSFFGRRRLKRRSEKTEVARSKRKH